MEIQMEERENDAQSGRRRVNWGKGVPPLRHHQVGRGRPSVGSRDDN